jgi:beta-ureidopropionase / N-carbamoyl-L-amino-acid hydrolase
MVGNLRINADRLWSSIMETARFGATPNGGINRLTLTKEDAAVRHWFNEQTEKLGCKVIVDEVGNMFAIRPGKRSGIDPIAMGSHLDTQPTGGKFDGVLGVLGGLEALRTIVESGPRNQCADCGGELDQRRRVAVCAADALFRCVCRHFQPRES